MAENKIKQLFKEIAKTEKAIRPFVAPKPCVSHPHPHL